MKYIKNYNFNSNGGSPAKSGATSVDPVIEYGAEYHINENSNPLIKWGFDNARSISKANFNSKPENKGKAWPGLKFPKTEEEAKDVPWTTATVKGADGKSYSVRMRPWLKDTLVFQGQKGFTGGRMKIPELISIINRSTMSPEEIKAFEGNKAAKATMKTMYSAFPGLYNNHAEVDPEAPELGDFLSIRNNKDTPAEDDDYIFLKYDAMDPRDDNDDEIEVEMSNNLRLGKSVNFASKRGSTLTEDQKTINRQSKIIKDLSTGVYIDGVPGDKVLKTANSVGGKLGLSGALVGAGVGVPIGAITGLLSGDSKKSKLKRLLIGGLIGGASGAGLGGLLGYTAGLGSSIYNPHAASKADAALGWGGLRNKPCMESGMKRQRF